MVCRGFVWVLCFDACCLCSALGFALVLVWLLFDCLGVVDAEWFCGFFVVCSWCCICWMLVECMLFGFVFGVVIVLRCFGVLVESGGFGCVG